MTRSEFGYFCAGVAAGALGHKFYPQLKDSLGPYMAGAMVFAQQAFGDALKDALATVESLKNGSDPVGPEFFGIRPPAAPPAAASDQAAA